MCGLMITVGLTNLYDERRLTITNFITARYIGYVVGNVKSMEGGYGLRIKLIYKDGETLVEENSGYKLEKEATCERECR